MYLLKYKVFALIVLAFPTLDQVQAEGNYFNYRQKFFVGIENKTFVWLFS